MRSKLLPHVFLLAGLSLYFNAPWNQPEVTPAEVCQPTQFQPPRLQPDRWNPCSVCDLGEPEIAVSPDESRPMFTGMEWACSDCGTVHLGPTTY